MLEELSKIENYLKERGIASIILDTSEIFPISSLVAAVKLDGGERTYDVIFNVVNGVLYTPQISLIQMFVELPFIVNESSYEKMAKKLGTLNYLNSIGHFIIDIKSQVGYKHMWLQDLDECLSSETMDETLRYFILFLEENYEDIRDIL